MPHYRVLNLVGDNYGAQLTVRTMAEQEKEEDPAARALIFQTSRGAQVWLGAKDVTALVDFGRAEVIAWESDDVVDAQVMCGAIYSDGVECALPDGHAPIGRGELRDGEHDTHVTPGGRVFDR